MTENRPPEPETAPIADLQWRLDGAANDRTREWWTGYLKGAARFRGVSMSETRRVVHEWAEDHGLEGRLDDDELLDLTAALLRAPDTEDKLAAMLLIQEALLPAGRLRWRDALETWAAAFDAGAIADWNACDWFSVKVLGPLIQREGEECARAVAGWIDAEGIWRRRASTVAFVELVVRQDNGIPGLTERVVSNCAALVESDHRFAQTAVGWVLRELSRVEPETVRAFVAEHGDRMSEEALRKATRHLDQAPGT